MSSKLKTNNDSHTRGTTNGSWTNYIETRQLINPRMARGTNLHPFSFSVISGFRAWELRDALWTIPRETYSAKFCGQVTEKVQPVFQWKIKDGGQ
jgi:hypothetical protein